MKRNKLSNIGTADVTEVQSSVLTLALGQFAFSNCTDNFYQGVTLSEMILGCKRGTSM